MIFIIIFFFAGLPGLYISESSPKNMKSICKGLHVNVKTTAEYSVDQ